MIWEIYQQGKIESATSSAEKAVRKTENFSSELNALKRQVNHLSLACQSMWELLREHSDLTELDLENRILEVDLRDGKADGKISTQVLSCPTCGKNTNSKRSNCLMCGASIRKAHKFEV